MELSIKNKLAKGIKEQAAIALIARLSGEGLDPEIAGQYIKAVSDGRADEVLESLGRNWLKLLKT